METTDEYRIRLREIADYAFSYGIKAIGFEPFKKGPPNTWDKETQTVFLTKCNEGYKIAQKLLITEVKYYQTVHRDLTLRLKELRRRRNKDKEMLCGDFIEEVEQRLQTLSHIADGIAWLLMGGRIHVARRFHIGQYKSKFIDSSNIEHAIIVSDSINKNPNDFALISDLTSFVQIGDILVRHRNLLGILELKEGKVNENITDFLNDLEQRGEKFDETMLENKFDDKTVKQIKRIKRQKERALKVVDIINKDQGIDPVSGLNITISTPTIFTENYHSELEKLEVELKSKNWAYSIVENCVHIGMYKNIDLPVGEVIIEQILRQQTENYIIVDWLSIIHNLSQPIFAKPFSPDFIIDVLTSEIKIIIGLNFDTLIELFNKLGLKTRWLTEKETNKIIQTSKRKGMVVINKRGLATKSNNQETIIYGGIISKIIYDNIKPSSIALSILSIKEGEK